jgi:hypothetical protein
MIFGEILDAKQEAWATPYHWLKWDSPFGIVKSS